MLKETDLPQGKKEAAWVIQETFKVGYSFAEKRLDKWLEQRNGLTIFEPVHK
jgi:hypothetical protein